MKTCLSIFGAFFLLLIIGVAGFVGYMAYTGSALDASSKAYVDESVPAIVKTWSRNEFLKRASPQVRKSIPDERVGELFIKFQQLGAFKSYDGCKGETNINVDQNGRLVTRELQSECNF